MPQRLQDSFFRALFDARVIGIAIADLRTGCVVEANERMSEILGCSRADLEGIPAKCGLDCLIEAPLS